MIEMQWLAAYLLLGCGVGFVAGLLGIGGGTLMVPVLTGLFAAQGFAGSHLLHLALGSSMAAIVLTSLSSMRSHHAHGAVLWPVVAKLAPGVLLGTFAMAQVAAQIPARPLAIFFAGFVLLIAVQMLLNVRPKPSRSLPGAPALTLTGLLIGAVSALVAIGGGSLTVPFLLWCNVSMPKAIGSSAAVGLPIALAGSLGYLVSGWQHADLPPQSWGYVYWPAVAAIALCSVLTAPLGARLTHRLPVALLKKLFAVLLLALAGKMLHGMLAI